MDSITIGWKKQAPGKVEIRPRAKAVEKPRIHKVNHPDCSNLSFNHFHSIRFNQKNRKKQYKLQIYFNEEIINQTDQTDQTSSLIILIYYLQNLMQFQKDRMILFLSK